MVVKIETNRIDKKIIKNTVEILKKGGLVIYPTETCYGIGCAVFSRNAIKKIYKIKRRERNKPLSLIVSREKMIEEYAEITPIVRNLIRKFMPGPLTIIVKTKNRLRKRTGRKTIAFRISSHPVAMALVEGIKVPIISTSANISGKPPLYKIKDVINAFNKKVDIIIDYGNLKKIRPSTCVDMTTEKIKIVREGPVKIECVPKS